jgi:hypothetical protein
MANALDSIPADLFPLTPDEIDTFSNVNEIYCLPSSVLGASSGFTPADAASALKYATRMFESNYPVRAVYKWNDSEQVWVCLAKAKSQTEKLTLDEISSALEESK